MGLADLGFMSDLFRTAHSLLDDDEDAPVQMFGLASVEPGSVLTYDDGPLRGLWVSTVATQGVMAAMDHVLMFHQLVRQPGSSVTGNAPRL